MKINIDEISVKIKESESNKNHENILGYASITIKEELGEYLTISGFTIWKSKYEGYNIEPPQSRNRFKYCQGTLLARIKKEIAKKYDKKLKYKDIPVID